MSGGLPDPRWASTWARWAVLASLAAAFLLGIWGFWSYEDALYKKEHGEEAADLSYHLRHLPSYFYHTAQLYVLHGHHLKFPPPVQLEIARFLCPIASFWAASKFISMLFDQPGRAMRMSRMRNHTVVLGDGEVASCLEQQLQRRRTPVVRVVSSGETPAARQGRVTLSGDPSSEEVLRELRFGRCTRVLLADACDERNVEFAASVEALLKRLTLSHPIACQIHVSAPELRDLFERQRSMQSFECMDTELLNVYEIEARRLFLARGLDHARVTAESDRRVEFVVVGFGKMGESLTLQTVRQGHFANGSVRITVYDRSGEYLGRRFASQYPELSSVVSVEFVELLAEDPLLRERLVEHVRDEKAVSTLALCLPDESANATLALRIARDLRESDTPAWVRIAHQEGLRRVLDGQAGNRERPVLVPFGALDEACRIAIDRDDVRESQAKRIHEDFRDRRSAEGSDPNGPSRTAWEALDAEFRESNREQADHIPVKLRAIGCRLVPVGDAVQPFEGFSEAEIETLAIMEHQRWWAERCLAGWRFVRGEKNAENRLSPYLTNWEDLSDEVKEWDRQAVRNIPDLAKRAGREITR